MCVILRKPPDIPPLQQGLARLILQQSLPGAHHLIILRYHRTLPLHNLCTSAHEIQGPPYPNTGPKPCPSTGAPRCPPYPQAPGPLPSHDLPTLDQADRPAPGELSTVLATHFPCNSAPRSPPSSDTSGPFHTTTCHHQRILRCGHKTPDLPGLWRAVQKSLRPCQQCST